MAKSGSALLSVVDFLTLGNHAFDAEKEYVDREPRVIRPANLGGDLPGRGWGTSRWVTCEWVSPMSREGCS